MTRRTLRAGPARSWTPPGTRGIPKRALATIQLMLSLAIGTEYFLFGGAGVVTLLAFTGLILAPAIGVLIVYYWPQITETVPGL